jgi:hypothetical protein
LATRIVKGFDIRKVHQNLEEEKTTGLRRIYKNSSTLRKVHQNLEEEKTAGLRR